MSNICKVVIINRNYKKSTKGEFYLDLSIKVLGENYEEISGLLDAKYWNAKKDDLLDGRLYEITYVDEIYSMRTIKKIETFKEIPIDSVLNDKIEHGTNILRDFMKSYKEPFAQYFKFAGNLIKNHLNHFCISPIEYRNYPLGAVESLLGTVNIVLQASDAYLLDGSKMITGLLLKLIQKSRENNFSSIGYITEKSDIARIYNGVDIELIKEVEAFFGEEQVNSDEVKFFKHLLLNDSEKDSVYLEAKIIYRIIDMDKDIAYSLNQEKIIK